MCSSLFWGDKRLCSQRVGRVYLRTLYCMIYLQKKIDHENATGGGDCDRHAAGICCLDLPPESLAHMSKNEQALRPAKNIIICRILSRVAYEETPCYLCHLNKHGNASVTSGAHDFKESVFFLPKHTWDTWARNRSFAVQRKIFNGFQAWLKVFAEQQTNLHSVNIEIQDNFSLDQHTVSRVYCLSCMM